MNATFCRWLGYTSQELTGKRLHDLLNIAGRIFYETHFAPLLRMQGFFDEVALDLVTHQGKRLPVLVNAAEKRDADGQHLFTRLTVFNATDRRRYERELLDAKAATEAARAELQRLHAIAEASLIDERATAALREQFIAVLGHDLRNPLASIGSGVNLLRKEQLSERGAWILNMLQGSTARMAALIDNVMDFARGRLGGGITLNHRVVRIEPILQQIVEELHLAAPEKVIETHFAVADPVRCDPTRLGQLVSNLLGNALTHGAATQPVRLDAASDGTNLTISVANGGDPIPPEAMSRLFQPFSRGEVRPSRQGLGLGLYIASEIAKAHGGHIEVVSTPDETCFTLRMPLAWLANIS